MKETAEDKYIHFRTISNNICIPDLLTHRGILTLHNELVKILKLPLQGLDQKPTQSPAIKENKHGILVNGLCLYPICRNSRSYWPILGHYPPVMLSGSITGLQKSKQPYNKQLMNLERSVFTRKSVNTARSRFEIFPIKTSLSVNKQLTLLVYYIPAHFYKSGLV